MIPPKRMAFAVQHPRAVIIGSTNNSSMGSLWARLISRAETPPAKIVSFSELSSHAEQLDQGLRDADEIFAVLDRQTMNWFAAKASVTAPLLCWQHELTLEPIELGLGNTLAQWIGATLWQIRPLADALKHLAQPQLADVYRVNGHDPLCRGG